MNNIRGANVVILKQPTMEEAENHFEYHPKYSIIAATQSQKLVEPKVFGLKQTLRVTKPARKNLKRSLAQQKSKNLNQLNSKIMRSLSFSPFCLEDWNMKDSTNVIDEKYGISGKLPPDLKKQRQLDKVDDRGYDVHKPRYYQKKTSLLLRPQEASKSQVDWSVIKITIPIQIIEGKVQFQLGEFFNTLVTFSIWQLLDRLPQLGVYLARVIASS